MVSPERYSVSPLPSTATAFSHRRSVPLSEQLRAVLIAFAIVPRPKPSLREQATEQRVIDALADELEEFRIEADAGQRGEARR